MRGKYSPTVTAAYMKDQNWWEKYSKKHRRLGTYASADGWNQYDPEGYDSYGYDKNDIDRAGNNEIDYYADDEVEYDEGSGLTDGENWRYNQALEDWGFDGVKPVLRK